MSAKIVELSMENLALAMLIGRVKTVAELASFLGIATVDKKILVGLEQQAVSLVPDIKKRFQANEANYNGPVRMFTQGNPFNPDTLCWHIWNHLAPGKWTHWGDIKTKVKCLCFIKSDSDLTTAIDIVANPWHDQNRGRSILFNTYDNLGFPLYRMEFSVPEPIMQVCEIAWGQLPSSHPPIDQEPIGNDRNVVEPTRLRTTNDN